MSGLIAWCAFFGGWLLVAGPMFQAAIELHDEDVARDEFEAATEAVLPRFPKVSRWWWLLPPVRYVLQARRSRRFRQAVMIEVGPEAVEGFVSFINKAQGWMFVAAGAFLIAVKETWELVEHEHWPHVVFWGLVVLMAMLCTANAALRMLRAQRMLEEHTAARATAIG